MTRRFVLSLEYFSISASSYLLDETVVVSYGLVPYFNHVLQLEHGVGSFVLILHRLDLLDSHY